MFASTPRFVSFLSLAGFGDHVDAKHRVLLVHWIQRRGYSAEC